MSILRPEAPGARPSLRVGSTATSMRCQSAGPLSAGIAAHSSWCWNQLMPELEISLALVAAAMVDDNRLNGQRHDEIAVGHLVDVPRTDAGRAW